MVYHKNNHRMRRIIVILIHCVFIIFCRAQTIPVSLTWDAPQLEIYGADTIHILHFEKAFYDLEYGLLPTYVHSHDLGSLEYDYSDYEVSLTNIEVTKVAPILEHISGIKDIGTEFKVASNFVYARDDVLMEVQVLPVRRLEDGSFEQLVNFEIKIEKKPKIKAKFASVEKGFVDKSVLASGTWVKVAVKETGIFKITYDDILGMGLDPQKIRVFGNGGKMLGVKFADREHDDLVENAVWYQMGSDGVFNSGDFLLFYAQGPNTWKYNETSGLYEHNQHKFDTKAFYFLTSSAGAGKRISQQPVINDDPTYETSVFDDYRFIEPENQNLLLSGAMWFSDIMNPNDVVNHTFSFLNILTDQTATVELSAVARTIKSGSTFSLYQSDDLLNTVSVSNSSTSNTGAFARMINIRKDFYPVGNNIDLNLKFSSNDLSGAGWYDYIRVSARCELKMQGNQMTFRDKFSQGNDIAKFNLIGVQQGLIVLDVSDVVNPEEVNGGMSGSIFSFKTKSNNFAEYIAFYPKSNFPKPEIIENVANQNLHGIGQTDYLIISHSKFMNQAERLANLHRANGLSVTVTELSKIYNEFSSGQRDITAIRWFIKSIYDRFSSDEKIRYVLLFGDGTFDNRINSPNNPNYIPTYQSLNSLNQSYTYVSDDYFVFMDNSEGSAGSNDRVDLGIGRFPVQTEYQATVAVDKVEYYMSNTDRKPWKNTVTFVADDKDYNIHARDANAMADQLLKSNPNIQVDKVFLHAFQRITLSSGPSYPDVNRIVENSIQNGTLIWNYTGHGGEIGLADEKIVGMSEISNYSNLNNMPLWVTATCDFGPFDRKNFTSAGEEVFLNPKGGGIALFTTTRLVYSNANYIINSKFYEYILAKDKDGLNYRLGDVFHLTKRNIGTNENKRKFCLLGDPALRLNYPTHEVVTSEINGIPVDQPFDTLKALQKITISGFITKPNGEFDSNYTGFVFPKIFDKITNKSTIVDDENPKALKFNSWENIIFKGKAEVVNGDFSFTFIVPKGIDYIEGFGKIVYYASSNDKRDGNGVFDKVIVGGFNKEHAPDDQGPELNAFMNSPDFEDGDVVNPDPMLIVQIKDASGINATGTSIGHDAIAILDKDINTYVVLNDYYESGFNSNDGQILFNFKDLSNGNHTLFLRVWDLYDNPSTSTINFRVDQNLKPDMVNLQCYPNPVRINSDAVWFKFAHDRPDQVITVEINVFDINGQVAAKLGPFQMASTGNSTDDILWNLKTKNGDRISSGIYFYKVHISDEKSKTTTETKKIIIY